MLFLPLGISYLYASATSRNPGPLDQASVKNEDDTSPRTVSLKVDDNAKVDILKLCLRNIFSTHRKSQLESSQRVLSSLRVAFCDHC